MAEKPMVEWLRQSLRDISELPTRGIAVAAVAENGDTYVNYYKISMTDKILISGLIQQDATMDALAQNGIIDYEDEDSNDESEEDSDEED